VTDDLKRRFKEHNSSNHKYSKKFQPWTINCYFAFSDNNKANKFEKYLKTASGRAFCKKHY
jgi:predicted GIY-YIG superfamily endonuclease